MNRRVTGPMRLLQLFLFLICIGASLEGAPFIVELKGHLDQAAVQEAQELIATYREGPPEPLVLHVYSDSGELLPCLGLARDLYELREQREIPCIVYIQETAIGPAAIFPFLANTLYISHFVAWGDVLFGLDDTYPRNLLRSRVRALIPSDHSHRKELTLLAEAMVDEELVVVDEGAGRLSTQSSAIGEVISRRGERLVVDRIQLQALGLVSAPLTLGEFEERFEPEQLLPDMQEITPETLPHSEVDVRLSQHITYHPEGPNEVGHILIKGPIDRSTWILAKAALDEYKKKRPICVILELNTPGGEVFPSQQISDALKELDSLHNIPVVAYINNWAISAGAMLAYSCRFIAIAKDAAMGAAEPVMQTAEGMTPASEKVSSALRADFANRANFFGRNPYIAEAMVDKDTILVIRHGKIIKLDSSDQIIKKGPYPDKILSSEGKLLTLNANQLLDLGVADFEVMPPPGSELTEEEARSGVWPADKSAIFQYPFFQAIPGASIHAYQANWRTRFFSILASPLVASLLFLGLMVGVYVELSTPGFGAAGTVALVCLFLIILSSFSMQAAHWLELILLMIGLILLAIEVFVLPGFGLAGVLGIIFTLAGVVALLLPGLGQVDFDFDTGKLNAAAEAVLTRLAWLGGAILVGALIIVLLARYVLPKFSRFSRIVLKGEQEAALGYVAGPDRRELPEVGSQGESVTPLRPAGKVLIRDHVYDAVSTGDYIDAGARIRIEHYEGSRMVVGREKGAAS